MPSGIPVNRQWVVVMRDGRVSIEWREGEYQDALSGEVYRSTPAQISHPVTNEDLDRLKRAGRVEEYNERMVYFLGLTEVPRKTID